MVRKGVVRKVILWGKKRCLDMLDVSSEIQATLNGSFRASAILLHGGMSAREANDPIRKAELDVDAKMLLYLAQFLSN
jgi:hypothetical protein